MVKTNEASTRPTFEACRPMNSGGLPRVTSLRFTFPTILHATGCSSAGRLRSITTIVKILRGRGAKERGCEKTLVKDVKGNEVRVRVLRSASTNGDASLGLPIHRRFEKRGPSLPGERKRAGVMAITGAGRRGGDLALSTKTAKS